ncbi:Phosphoethanolamine transferase [Candidatus Hepatincolaceae symbiont of Richtersius coronifer]
MIKFPFAFSHIKESLQKNSRIIFIILFSLYIGAFFNLATAKNVLFADLFLIFASLCVILGLFSFNNLLLKSITIIFIICNTIAFYIQYFLKVDIGLNMIASFFNTNQSEALEQLSIISWLNWLFLLSIFVIPSLIVICYPLKFHNFSYKSYIYKLLGLWIINFLVVFLWTPFKFYDNYNKSLFTFIEKIGFNYNIELIPVNYVYNLVKYLTVVNSSVTYKNLITQYPFNLTSKSKEPYNIVLIIGETARNANFSLGDYKRETNPLLKQQKNLVYYSSFYSCNTGTILSVSCLLSYRSGEEFRKYLPFSLTNEVASFSEIFNAFDFETYLISTNAYRPKDPMFSHIKEVQNIYYFPYKMGFKDGDLIIKLQEIISKGKKNKLIILHTMGSHFQYSARYPEGFAKWKPVCNEASEKLAFGACTSAALINEYDNSILYTDFVLNSMMQLLEEQSSMLLYVSDHGENLGEGNRYLHGSDYAQAYKGELNIPGIIWFSDKWLKTFGEAQFNNAFVKKTSTLNHDFVFHSILDCAFIKSPFIDKSLSLCANIRAKDITSTLPPFALLKDAK